MKYYKTESNIYPNQIVIENDIIDVNLNVETFTRDDETFYSYDTYRFNRNEIIETDLRYIKIECLIRTRYSINDELAILRQKDTKPNEYQEYNEFVEWCKEQ